MPASPAAQMDPQYGFQGPQFAQPFNVTWNTRIFDEKVTERAEYKFTAAPSGDNDGWIKRIEDYVIGKCPDLGPLMHWAAGLGRTAVITGDVLAAAVNGQPQRCDVHVLNGHLWWFLGLCTDGAGKTIYRTAVPHSGLDAWRILRAFIGDRSPQKRQILREKLKTVQKVKSYGAIELAITQWESD